MTQRVKIEPRRIKYLEELKASNEMCIDPPVTNEIVTIEEYSNLSSHLGSTAAFENGNRVQ